MTKTFKNEINPWGHLDCLRPSVKTPRTVRVLCVTRDKSGKIIKAEVRKEAGH